MTLNAHTDLFKIHTLDKPRFLINGIGFHITDKPHLHTNHNDRIPLTAQEAAHVENLEEVIEGQETATEKFTYHAQHHQRQTQSYERRSGLRGRTWTALKEFFTDVKPKQLLRIEVKNTAYDLHASKLLQDLTDKLLTEPGHTNNQLMEGYVRLHDSIKDLYQASKEHLEAIEPRAQKISVIDNTYENAKELFGHGTKAQN